MTPITPEQEHRNSIKFCSVTHPYVFNGFVNCPSTLQPYHQYHGVRATVIVTRRFKKDVPTTATIHFGSVTVHDVPLPLISKLYA